MSNQTTAAATVTVFATSGWQNIAQAVEHNQTVKVRKMQIPADVVEGATDYTHARHTSFDALCDNVCEAAGVDRSKVKFELVEEDNA